MGLFKNKKGSITVFLSLIMSGILIFTVVLIDAGKIVTARSAVSGAGDLALAAGLSQYNSVLQDTYGLFANSQDMTELRANLEKYFTATLKSNGIENQGLVKDLVDAIVTSDDVDELLDIKPEIVEVSGQGDSALSNSKVLRSEILEYMKYRGPVVIGYGFLEKLNVLKSLPQQQEALEGKVNYEKQLSEIEKICKEAYELCKAYQDYIPPEDDNTGSGNKLDTPDEIMTFGLHECNKAFPIMTNSAIAYSVINELDEDADWGAIVDEPNSEGNVILEHTNSLRESMDMFENKTGTFGVLHELYNAAITALNSVDIDGYASDENWTRFEAVYQYKIYYDDRVYLFQDTNKQYDEEKTAYEEAMDELEAQLDEDEDDEEDDGNADIYRQMEELTEAWEPLENWYLQVYPVNYGKKYAWRTVKALFLEDVKTQLDQKGKDVVFQIDMFYNWAKELDDLSKNAIDKLNELKERSAELDGLAQEWQESINGLPDSTGIKSDMQLDHDSKAEAIDDTKIQDTIDIITRGQTYAEDVMRELDNIKYMDVKIVGNTMEDWTSYASGKIDGIRTDNNIITDNTNVVSFMEHCRDDLGYFTIINESRINQIYNVEGQAISAGVDSPPLYNYISLVSNDKTKKDVVYEFLERSAKFGEVNVASKSEAEDEQKNMANASQENELSSVQSGSVVKGMDNSVSGDSFAGSESINGTEEAEKVADSAVETTGNAISGFTSIGQILTSGRDKLYLMTYATNMFSCYTTNITDGVETKAENKDKIEKTLTNIPYSTVNNTLYRSEQEYILWGNSDAMTNVNYTKGSIFGVRLLLNIIYAYTGDPELQTETLTMATAIAGWTGFGVPIVQNALLIIAAVAESTEDVNQLMKGNTIPLYKTPQTWMFKYTGFGEKTVEALVAEAAKKSSSQLYAEMNKLTDGMTKEFDEQLDLYTKNAVETLVGTAMSAVEAPIQQTILQCVAHIEETENNFESEVRSRIDVCFTNLQTQFEEEKSGDDGSGSIAADVKLEALRLINNESFKNQLVSYVMDISQMEDVKTQTSTISKEIKEWFNGQTNDIEKALSKFVDDTGIVDALNDDIDAIANEANQNIQEAINDRMNAFIDKMGTSSTPISNTATGGSQMFSEFDSTSASTFSMNYKDYLMVFLAIRFLSSEDNAVCCMGNLIQTNANNKDSQYYCGENFKLSSAYTILQLKVTASVKPTFMNLPRFNNNNEYYSKDRYPIYYQGALGY